MHSTHAMMLEIWEGPYQSPGLYPCSSACFIRECRENGHSFCGESANQDRIWGGREVEVLPTEQVVHTS